MQSSNVEAWTSTVQADIFQNGQVVSKRMDLLLGSSLGACKGTMHTPTCQTCCNQAQSLFVHSSITHTSRSRGLHPFIWPTVCDSGSRPAPMIPACCRLPTITNTSTPPVYNTNALADQLTHSSHSVIQSPTYPPTHTYVACQI